MAWFICGKFDIVGATSTIGRKQEVGIRFVFPCDYLVFGEDPQAWQLTAMSY